MLSAGYQVFVCYTTVLGIELRHLKVKGFGKIGSEKSDVSLCRSYPAAMTVKDLTIVKVNYDLLAICFVCIHAYII